MGALTLLALTGDRGVLFEWGSNYGQGVKELSVSHPGEGRAARTTRFLARISAGLFTPVLYARFYHKPKIRISIDLSPTAYTATSAVPSGNTSDRPSPRSQRFPRMEGE